MKWKDIKNGMRVKCTKYYVSDIIKGGVYTLLYSKKWKNWIICNEDGETDYAINQPYQAEDFEPIPITLKDLLK